MSVRRAEESDRVLLRCRDGHRSQQRVAVGERRRAVDGHDACNFESDFAEVVNVAGRLEKQITRGNENTNKI